MSAELRLPQDSAASANDSERCRRAEALVRRLIAGPRPDGWQPTGFGREGYLDLAENLVRWLAEHSLQADGTMKDEAGGTDDPATSWRWCSAASILLRFGRIPDLLPAVCDAMDRSCADVANRTTRVGFAMPELTVAIHSLQDVADKARVDAWRRQFSAFDPDKLYARDLAEFTHNWVAFMCAGESLRESIGLPPAGPGLWGHAFFDRHMPSQLARISDLGMYRDPDDPMTYDIGTRIKYATALVLGYPGELRPALDATLRRAGYATLLFMSPAGYVPYGGRSDQSLFQEAIVAALCEVEACRHRRDLPLAGAFRRQAHLSVRSIYRWASMRPPRPIKNGFPAAARHGFDSYRIFCTDTALLAAFLGLAALFADDTIHEAPCPSEIGGYVFELTPDFHKVQATVRGGHLQVDTAADLIYNATGLGRYLVPGVPLELGPGMPLACDAMRWGRKAVHYAPGYPPGGVPVGIGPAWPAGAEWISLAGLTAESGLTHETTVEEESPDRAKLRIAYTHAPSQSVITESYDLTPQRLAISTSVHVKGAASPELRFTVPLLVTDGEIESEFTQPNQGMIRISYRGADLVIHYPADARVHVADETCANRHGAYRVMTLSLPCHTIQIEVALGRSGNPGVLT